MSRQPFSKQDKIEWYGQVSSAMEILIIIRSNKGEYILMAHFKINSITIKKGERVKQGQLLGYAGNLGNSSEPHLHLHLMNAATLKEGTGIKCYFQKLLVNNKVLTHYSPVKGERIRYIV